MKSKKLIGKMFLSLGGLLLTGSVLLFGYNRRAEYTASKASNKALKAVQEQIETKRHEKKLGSHPKPTLEWDETVYLGILTIPELGLELPVQSDWSYPKLRNNPCVYAGSIQSGGLVILAHNYDCHFGRLNSLHQGSEILLTDAVGQEYKYGVEEIFVMDATDVEEMTDESYDLTLFTCTYGGKARVTVRCMLQNQLDGYPEI